MRKSKLMTRLMAAALAVTLVLPGVSVQAAEAPAQTTEIDAQAIENAELASAPDAQAEEVVTTVEDSQTTSSGELFKIQYSDGWNAESGYMNLFSGGDDHYSPVPGAYFEMNFIGHKFELVASLNQQHGVYDVYVDEELIGTADSTTTGTTTHQQVIFASETLEEGEHTLRVVLKSGYPNIQIDCVRVYHEELKPTDIMINDWGIRLEIGSQTQVVAEIYPSIITNAKIIWKSQNEEIATVDKNGNVTAVSEGEAIITATIEGTNLEAHAHIYVVPVVEYLSATFASPERLETQDDYDVLKGEYVDYENDDAWKGDVLYAKLSLCSRDEVVKNAEVTASDFVSGDNVITSDNVEIKWLKEVQANIGRGNPYAPVENFPDVIYKGGKTDIEAESVKYSWITINVPADAEPGTYEGTFTVTADELEEPYIFTYSFEVYDLVQPTAADVDTQIQIWQHPFSVANYYGVAEEDYFTEEHFKYMRASMEEYKELGGEDIVANIVEEAWNHQSYYSDPSMVKWTKNSDGTYTFDYTWYDAWINFLVECGVLDPENGVGQIKCYSIVPWNNQIAYYDEASGRTVTKSYTPGAADWNKVWTIFLRDFMAHSKEMGWFDITYISMDERSMDQLEPAVELIESVVDEDGESFMISSAFNYSNERDYSFTDRLDDISINLGYISNSSEKFRAMSEHRRELGLTTTIYTCTGNYPGNFTISDPADNYWVMWYSMKHSTNGFMRWAWDNWVEDPLTNVTYKYWEPGDGWFIYPVEKDAADNTDYFYSTPRYEMLKKGVRDINKAKYLMSLDEEMASVITRVIETLQQPQQGNNGYGSAAAAGEADRELVFAETARMHSSIMGLAYEYIEVNKPEPTPTPGPTPTPEPKPENYVNPFKDVARKSFYYNPVLWGSAHKVVAGLTNDMFGPNVTCTRGQIVTFIWRALGRPETVNQTHPFTDVETDDFYYKAILWAVENKVTSGYTETIFAPDVTCTRAEIVTFLWRAFGKPAATSAQHPFTDVKTDAFYYNAMLWAVERGIAKGYTATMFAPYASITRGETVTFLYRTFYEAESISPIGTWKIVYKVKDIQESSGVVGENYDIYENIEVPVTLKLFHDNTYIMTMDVDKLVNDMYQVTVDYIDQMFEEAIKEAGAEGIVTVDDLWAKSEKTKEELRAEFDSYKAEIQDCVEGYYLMEDGRLYMNESLEEELDLTAYVTYELTETELICTAKYVDGVRDDAGYPQTFTKVK